uniref:Glycosyl transferase n=1 Tax=uncultured marine group II/III euryarchaeote KM3_155_G07 TaxID=1457898 RepID=A0A075GDT4_9EURY|nr:glycosyl transferase [uncultured marine group II/III euryarchaeote KM3_155_G07]
MHIAMLSGEYPPRWGGMGSTVFHLSGALAKMGHRVTVITRSSSGTSAPIPQQEGVSVRSVRWAKIPMAFTRSYGKNALKELLALHETDTVDSVHLHAPMISWNEKQFAVVRAAIGNVTTTLHGSWLGEKDGMILAAKYGEAAVWKNPNDLAILLTGKHYAKYERSAICGSTVCVANSEATKRDFESRYEPPENWNCEVVRWGVDVEMFHPINRDQEEEQLAHESMRRKYGNPDEAALTGRLPREGVSNLDGTGESEVDEQGTKTPLLLAVGRLVARKGFLTLLKAMPEIVAANPGVHLVIVGRGHMRKTLEKQAKKLFVSNHVTIEPGMPFDELAQLFRSADLSVYPSYYEGQGLIPLESMASGVPCVTVDDGPLPEMVDDSVGGLFELGNPASLADSVNRILADPALRADMAMKGRKRVLDEYTYELNAEKYAEFYSK